MKEVGRRIKEEGRTRPERSRREGYTRRINKDKRI